MCIPLMTCTHHTTIPTGILPSHKRAHHVADEYILAVLLDNFRVQYYHTCKPMELYITVVSLAAHNGYIAH
jgi:hypothetical protein